MTNPSKIKALKPTKSLSGFAAKTWRSLPLRTVLIVPFVAQIVGAVGLVGYLSFRNGQKAVEDLAQQLMGEASKRVEDKLTNFLGNAELVNQLTADAIDRGELSLNLEQPQPKGEKYLWQQMRAFKNLRWISFSGEATGGFIGIVRSEKNNNLELVIANGSTNHRNIYYAIEKTGVRGKTLKIVPELYEPRTRFWYKKAVAANRLVWLDIYQGFRKEDFFISAIQPIRDRQGKLLGVSSADFTLAEFQNFLNQIKLSENGQIFALEQSGLLVASTSGEPPFQEVPGKKEAQRVSVLNSQTPLIRTTAQYLSKSFQGFDKIKQRQQLQFTENGQRYFVQVVPFVGKNGLKWSIAIAVPESDFMAQINANNRTTILLCLAALTIATILGIFTSRWITRPIFRLQQASEAIATGELDRTIEIDGINELKRLARAFNEMAAQLKTSFTELEDRVAERTEALQQANQKLLELAISDELTQIPNRRHFDECLNKEWQRHLREQKFLALILIDIDYFKLYNDNYGHLCGDKCLFRVAQAINNLPKRSSDCVARYGGEEFVAILPNTPAEGAFIVAELLRKAVLSLAIPHAKSEVSSYVTLSLGVAALIPTPDNQPENLIARADEALYQAKKLGRNQSYVRGISQETVTPINLKTLKYEDDGVKITSTIPDAVSRADRDYQQPLNLHEGID